MSLEGKLDIKEIITKSGMSSRPGVHSGRGATISDLNSEILEKFYKNIKYEYGKFASEQFLEMVSEIPVMSATDFLLNLYKLESNNWKWKKSLLGNEKGVYIDGRTDNERLSVGFATIISMLGRNEMDDSNLIKCPFLKNHGVKIKGNYKERNFLY